jgi:hypothetical protein
MHQKLKARHGMWAQQSIAFPALGSVAPSMAPMVISAQIAETMIRKIYINGGSASDIMYEHCFNGFPSYIKSQMKPTTTTLMGFTGDTLRPFRQLTLCHLEGRSFTSD